jgi:hypothetical protein
MHILHFFTSIHNVNSTKGYPSSSIQADATTSAEGDTTVEPNVETSVENQTASNDVAMDGGSSMGNDSTNSSPKESPLQNDACVFQYNISDALLVTFS